MKRRIFVKLLTLLTFGMVTLVGCYTTTTETQATPTNLPTMTYKNVPSGTVDYKQLTMEAWETQVANNNATLDVKHSLTALIPTNTPTLFPDLEVITPENISRIEVIRYLSGHTNLHTAVDFSPDGKWLASGNQDSSVKIWNPSTGSDIRTISLYQAGGVAGLAFSPDGNILGIRGNTSIELFETGSWEKISGFNGGDSQSFSNVAFSPDGIYFAYDMQYWSEDKSFIKVWSLVSETEVISLEWPKFEPMILFKFTPDSKELAIYDQGTIDFWNIEGRDISRTLYSSRPFEFSHDGGFLIAESYDAPNILSIWGLPGYQRLPSLFDDPSYNIRRLAVSYDSNWLVTGGNDGNLSFWDLDKMQFIINMPGHSDGVFDIAISPDGKHIATVSWGDDSIFIWGVPVEE